MTATAANPAKLARPPAPLSLERERLRVVIFGEPGKGKTTLAATFPRPLFIDTDGGMISLAVRGIKPLVYDPTGYKDLEGAFWWAKERQDQFETVVFDSVSTMQRLLLDEIHDLSLAAKVGEVKPVMQWVPEQGEYLAQQRQLARILTDFRRLGKHLVLTAGVRDRMGRRSPDVAPGLFAILSHWASIMGELVVVDTDDKGKQLDPPHRVLITGHGQRDGKSRFRSLLPYVAEPSFDAMWGRVMKEYEAAEGTTTKTKETA